MGFTKLAEDRFILVDGVGKGVFLAVHVNQERRLVFALQHSGRGAAGEAGQPDRLLFHNRIEHKLGGIRQLLRESNLQLIVELFRQAGDLQPFRVAGRGRALPGPHNIFQAAFLADVAGKFTVRGGGEKMDGFVDIGLAAAIWAKDDIQRPQLQLDIPDRSEILYAEMVDHGAP